VRGKSLYMESDFTQRTGQILANLLPVESDFAQRTGQKKEHFDSKS
jgi:hypothetical protein